MFEPKTAEPSVRKMLEVAAIIPAVNPAENLIPLVHELRELGFAPIILIDDGSDDPYQDLFSALANMPNIDVLRHAASLGKGRALTTGFNHFLLNYPTSKGAVTIDASAGYSADDAVAVAEALLRNTKNLVLGSRAFGEGLPLKARMGNLFTRSLLRFVSGKSISDAQSGLRGISRSAIQKMMALAGERYEFETGMLLNSSKFADSVVEQPIHTTRK